MPAPQTMALSQPQSARAPEGLLDAEMPGHVHQRRTRRRVLLLHPPLQRSGLQVVVVRRLGRIDRGLGAGPVRDALASSVRTWLAAMQRAIASVDPRLFATGPGTLEAYYLLAEAEAIRKTTK